jgi:hypothetical protein
MKKLAAILCLAALTTGAFAQGTVNFGNGTATLISYRTAVGAPPVTIPNVAGQFYFGLFAAPNGTTDINLFQFTGNYATNLASAGRLLGGSAAVVNGWAPGETRDVIVRGWSRDLGHDWNPQWLQGIFPGATPTSVFGTSAIGVRLIGGGGPSSLPSPVIFSSTGITAGFTMDLVPEPTSMALAGLGAAALLIFRRRK